MYTDHDFLSRWERIVNDVDKENVPIHCVKKVVFRTIDRRQRTINLAHLRKQGVDEEGIESAVTNFIQENENCINRMELILDVEAVAATVQPQTDKLLKGM